MGLLFRSPNVGTKAQAGRSTRTLSGPSEELGIDYAAAVMRVEKVLLPQFESWRTRGISDPVPETSAREGTLRWMFVVYKATTAGSSAPGPCEAAAQHSRCADYCRRHNQGCRAAGLAHPPA